MTKKRKQYITLIEMMIVMFLIAMITGVIAYNYRGSLEEGKAFKTKAAKEKLETILSLYDAEHPDFTVSDWEQVIKNSPLVHDQKALIYDGWGRRFDVTRDEQYNIIVASSNLEEHDRKQH